MNKVWLIMFCDGRLTETGTVVAGSATKAYDICTDYIRTWLEGAIRDNALEELRQEFLEFPESFACEGICWAEAKEVL